MAPSTRKNLELATKIEHMRLNIAPIVHVETGIPPVEFPSTMLQFFLLTEDQLDAMAHYYEQSTPGPNTYDYPQTMDWNKPFLSRPKEDQKAEEGCGFSDFERLRIKMRIFARFIGMSGAETPRWEYERQIEILKNRINKSIEAEERRVPMKCYQGPPTLH
ncbi:hypothetical protein CC78DRAFT_137792 [Lojkania enalia]|uniref:Uncharacterized protein n=1 Tax=Lojkania enalia TaxID=147567 RepID=A0A9P4NCH9_9PLEO|nr:hypothetical protein CC78DRAFT_137792 [Didymosphaeria enalia]